MAKKRVVTASINGTQREFLCEPRWTLLEALRDELDILGWEMEPGDAVAFNFRTLHGAPANASPNRRRVISMRWVGDDAVFAKRLGTTSPAFPDLDYTPGTPFDAPEFPVLYTE